MIDLNKFYLHKRFVFVVVIVPIDGDRQEAESKVKDKMRFRKTNALVGALVAVGALFMVYLVIDTISVQYEEAELQKVYKQSQMPK